MASTITGSVEAENSRQGVEINGFAQVFASALPRILSNSTPKLVLDGRPIDGKRYFDDTVTTQVDSKKLKRAPNHQAEQRDLGVPKTHYDDTPFEEMFPLDPVTYVGDENFDVRYPVVLDAVSPVDPAVYDGILEPFAIRDVAARMNTESPFESRRIRGTIANSHEDLLGRSVPIEQKVYYEGYQGQTRAYQEFGDNLERPIDLKFTYFPDEPLLSVPFTDSDDATLMASRVSDDSFVEILEGATGSYTKFGSTFRSSRTGYTYRDTENGTDSFAFADRVSHLSASSPFNSRQRITRVSSPVNIGFSDAAPSRKVTPFDANRVVEGVSTYYPGNASRSPLVSGGKTQDISIIGSSSLIQDGLTTVSDDITSAGYKDDITKADLLLPDGTYGKSVIKIDISSRANWDPAHEVYQLGPTTYDFRDSVVAHWNFETPVTGSGNGTVEDKSGNGHTGTLYGDSSVDLNWAPGPITTRGNLNLERVADASTSDYMRVDDADDLSFSTGSGKSISFWLRLAAINKSHQLLWKRDEYFISINVSEQLTFTIDGNGGGTITAATAINTFEANKWYHVALSYGGGDESTLAVYLNGTRLTTSNTFSGVWDFPRTTTNRLYVGGSQTSTASFSGRFASIEVWDKQLTDSEVNAIYKLQLQGTQYMGRTDSRMASLTKTANWAGGSLFISSAFRNSSSSFDRYNGHETGIAGTGFYYYSPFYKRWVEKRSDHATSISNSRYWTGGGGNTVTKDEADAVNAIEINHYPDPQEDGSLSTSELDVAKTSTSIGYYWASSKMHVSGTNEILSQFAGSPQLGYFLPYTEHLTRMGYSSIGTPTVVFQAPNAPKYHAFDEETIKLSDYIDRPFLLRKMIVKVPVQLRRRNELVSTNFGSSRWAKNVVCRKDIDNYTFFLYRQRRTEKNKDSISDISSSVRFLIASSSVCVYNSASFGQAEYDGFYNVFGTSTPLSQSFLGGLFTSAYVKDITSFTTGNLYDPLTQGSLTRNNSPLHSPALAVNAGLTVALGGSTQLDVYTAQGGLKLTSYPTVVLGSYPVSTLFHVTSSTANYSSSFYSYFTAIANRLFNRYPYTGSFSNLSLSSSRPPITTVVQNFWYGGTRQPVFNTTASPTVTNPGSQGSYSYRPYMQFNGTETSFLTDESQQFNQIYTEPTFDIELGRVGISLFDDKTNIFENPFDIPVDGRSIPVGLGKSAKPTKAGVIQRSNLINFESYASEDSTSYGSQFTIGHLSGSSVAELVASLTTGYAPVSQLSEKQILRDYILMPTDELVLGLDAGVTPPPDIAPMFGQPRPDYQAPDLHIDISGPGIQLGSLKNTTRTFPGVGVTSVVKGRVLGSTPTVKVNTNVTLGGERTVTIPRTGGTDTTPRAIDPGGTNTGPGFDGTIIIETPDDRAVVTYVDTTSDVSNTSYAPINVPRCYLEGPPIDDFMKIVEWNGMPRGFRFREWMNYLNTPAASIVDPQPRGNQTPFVTPIMRETLPHYSGNSWLRILHGEAEIILIGEYLADGSGKQITRGSFSDDMTQVVGDSFVVDQFDNAESDALYGTYLSDIVTGTFRSGDRGVSADGASRTATAGSNVQRYVKLTSDSVVLHDLFFSGVNESPASAHRNAPEPFGFVRNPFERILGGVSIASGSFFRGRAALKRKPAVKVSAYFRSNHWGYFSDLVQGVENTKTYELGDPGRGKIENSPVIVRFVSGVDPAIPVQTSSQNISKTSAVDTPYVDGQAVSRSPIDDEEIITI